MSWPVCPDCGLTKVPRVDGGPGEIDGQVLQARAYRCWCGWEAITHEVVVTVGPPTLGVRRRLPPVTVPGAGQRH